MSENNKELLDKAEEISNGLKRLSKKSRKVVMPYHSSYDLIEELDRLYPEKIEPTVEMEVKDIFYRAGQVSVVRKLKQMHMDKQESQNNALISSNLRG